MIYGMNSLEAYRMYLTLKIHFRNDGKTDDFFQLKVRKVNEETFLRRKDRFFFERVSRKYGEKTLEFFLANFIKNPKGWIGNFNEGNYNDWIKTKQSLGYIFKTDIEKLLDEENIEHFDGLFVCPNGQHPIILKRFLGGKVHLETMVILDKLVNYSSQFDEQIQEDIVWPDARNLIKKYGSFLNNINIQKFDSTLKQLLSRYK